MQRVGRIGMLTRYNKNMTRFVFTFILVSITLLGCHNSTSDSALYAWWVNAKFEPSGATINGIRLDKIDSEWIGAKRLSTEEVASIASPAEQAEFAQSQFKFTMSMDLDNDAIVENFYVGVFKTKNATGRFLIIEKNNNIVMKFQREDMPGFSALLKYKNELRWYKCMQCGDYEKIVAANGGFLLLEGD